MPPPISISLRVVLGFLKAGRVLDGASSVLLLGTLALALLGRQAVPLVVAGVVLAGIEKYFAWRIALDAEFFTLLVEQPDEVAAFDAALATFLGQKTAPPPRTMASRWRGARRLVLYQALALGAQAVAAGALVVWGLR